MSTHYPPLSEAGLKQTYVGTQLKDIDNLPAAVVDAAVVRRNCRDMLEMTEALGVSFRAHVKTHKTTEITRLQVGETSKTVKLVVSTVVEIEQLIPYLLDCQKKGRTVNVLYGVPAPPGAIGRLKEIRKILGPESLSLMIDSPDQLRVLAALNFDDPADQVPIFIKIDTGSHRAGLDPGSDILTDLLESVVGDKGSKNGKLLRVLLIGFYSHMGKSYGVDRSLKALDYLVMEIQKAIEAANHITKYTTGQARYVISVGATPTVASAKNLLLDAPGSAKVKALIEEVKGTYDLELHAGVYPFLDIQQLATHVEGNPDTGELVRTTRDLGLRILVQVASVYSDREKPEALIAAGSLALGREPCKSYPGWGIVSPTPWLPDVVEDGISFGEMMRREWRVDRISQEHGILALQAPCQDTRRTFHIGEKLMIWPNHACIAAAGYGWYLIVDSDLGPEQANTVLDVWSRWRGW